MTDLSNDLAWYAVRCVFQSPDEEGDDLWQYEERITIWQATDFDHAIELAEEEAAAYVAAAEVATTYVELAQAYELPTTEAPGHGDEVVSLFRQSDLGPDEYVDHFFDDGEELQDDVEDDGTGAVEGSPEA